ncbi:synaptoporin-like [Convolutriloba macropyga]|uniref:synaptoporin-like n=1 Tax=Convolutriloba macropyga TaxID=536237 RepID=UPI003F52561C
MGGLRELSVQTNLNDNGVRLPICPDESVESFKLKVSNSDQESSFKFFVFTGVLCFVYGIVVLVAYVFISPTLESHDGIGFKIDVVVHIVLCIFWFCGSFALIRAKNQVAKYTDPDRVLKEIPECVDTDGNGKTTMLCEVTNSPEYRALGFAVGMGFVNLFAWCSNIYFLLKDTPWFELIFNRWSDNPGTSGAAQRYGSNPYGANTTGDSSLPPPADSQHQIPP